MLPLLSALRARSCHAPASVIRRCLVGAFIFAKVAAIGASASELLVLGNVPGDQDNPSAALGVNGGFIVWEDNRVQAGREGKGIAAAAVSSELQIAGGVFRVSTQKEGRQERPQVVALSGGEHLVVWEVRNGKNPGVFARVIGTNGTFIGSDVMVNVPTAKVTQKVSTNWTAPYRGVVKSRQHRFKELITSTREQAGAASVAALADGGALVAYHVMRRSDTYSWRLEGRTLSSKGGDIQDSVLRPFRSGNDFMSDVFLQRLDRRGFKVGEEVLVNQTTELNQRSPALAILANGNVLLTWVSELERPTELPIHPDGRTRPSKNYPVMLVARLFDPQLQPLGDEFAIASSEEAVQANPSVQSLSDGGFLVGWSQQDAAGGGWDVYARSFMMDGTATGPAIRLNSHTTGDQYAPRFTRAGEQILVVWTSVGEDGSREGLFARRLHGGALLGGQFQVNHTTASRQWHPSVAADGAGGAVVLWSGFTGANGFDLFSARYFLGGAQ